MRIALLACLLVASAGCASNLGMTAGAKRPYNQANLDWAGNQCGIDRPLAYAGRHWIVMSGRWAPPVEAYLDCLKGKLRLPADINVLMP